jgi:hypothetical protein
MRINFTIAIKQHQVTLYLMDSQIFELALLIDIVTFTQYFGTLQH